MVPGAASKTPVASALVVRPALLLVVLSTVLYGGLYVVGWWAVRVIKYASPTTMTPPTALVGLVILQFASWYWSTIGWGLNSLWVPLLAGSVVAGGVAMRRCPNDRDPDRERPTTRWARLTAGLGAGALTLLHADEQLARGTLSISSSNNDAPLYALVARHLSAEGLRDAGSVAGMDLGNWAALDYYGAFSYYAFSTWIGNHSAFQLALPALLVAIVILAQTLASLIDSTTELPWHLTSLIVLIALSPYLFIWTVWNYFLAQVLGMAFCVAIFTVMLGLRDGARPSSPRGNFVVLTLLMLGLIFSYPHMAFLFLPVAGAVIVLSDPLHWRRSTYIILTALGALAVTAAIVPERIVRSVDKLITLNSVVAGFPLPGVLPWGLVGFQSSFDNTVSAATIAGSIVVCVGVFTAANVARRRGAPATFPVEATIVVVLASYAVFYFVRGGPTYEQWKWISFLQPLFIVAVVLPLVVVARHRPRHISALAVALLLVGLLAIVVNRSEPVSARMNTSSTYVPYELGELGKSPAFDDIDAVNVLLAPYWESMWAAVSLWPRTSYMLSATYYPRSAPTAEWTLVHTASVPRPTPQQTMRSVAGHYTVVRAPEGSDSTEADLLDAEITTSIDRVAGDEGVLSGVVTVENTGTSYWIGTGAPTGGVSVGVQLVGDGNQVIRPDFARIPIRTFPFVVVPGERIRIPFTLPPLETGDHRLNFFVVAQHVANFGDRADELVSIT